VQVTDADFVAARAAGFVKTSSSSWRRALRAEDMRCGRAVRPAVWRWSGGRGRRHRRPGRAG